MVCSDMCSTYMMSCFVWKLFAVGDDSYVMFV